MLHVDTPPPSGSFVAVLEWIESLKPGVVEFMIMGRHAILRFMVDGAMVMEQGGHGLGRIQARLS